MKIGKLAAATGLSVQTIRYYEQQYLLTKPQRSEGNYRLYDKSAVVQLNFIKQCRSLGISITDIKTIMSLQRQPKDSCQEVNKMIQQHLLNVSDKIEQLQQLEQTLRTISNACQSSNDIAHCGILKHLNVNASNELSTPKKR